MSDFDWPPYVPAAEKRRQALRELAKLRKRGQLIVPVMIEGRTIAKTFWGKSWCTNLERYSDYASRLPRGRTYVRNGSVLDLKIARGEVAARVAGSSLYEIKIAIAPVKAARWKAICRDCAGGIDSLVELLQGRLARGIMDRVCREGDGLFPSPEEIKLSCSCPDWADMCKHVAAALYGVGARLDEKPELLFVLRGVDENELLADAGPDLVGTGAVPSAAKLLGDSDVAALFGLEMADSAAFDTHVPAAPKRHRGSGTSRGNAAPAATKAAAAKKSKSPVAVRKKSGRKATSTGTGKGGARRRS
jgi:uncharacterized Zn finger protein